MPSSVVPSVPNFLTRDPFPDNSGSSHLPFTPFADFFMSSVSSHEVKAFSLSCEDVSILSVNLSLGLRVVASVRVFVGSLVSISFNFNKRRFVDSVEVFTLILKVSSLLGQV